MREEVDEIAARASAFGWRAREINHASDGGCFCEPGLDFRICG